MNLTKQVLTTLKDYPKTRNDDLNLTLTIWYRYYSDLLEPFTEGNIPMVRLDKVMKLPREDHIKRIRAKVQNEDKLYLPTDTNVLRKRMKSSKAWKEYLGYSESKNNYDSLVDEFITEHYIKA